MMRPAAGRFDQPAVAEDLAQGATRCHDGWLTLAQGTVRDVPATGSRRTWSSTVPETLVGVPRIDESSGAHSQSVTVPVSMPPGYGISRPGPLPSTGTMTGRA